MRTIAEKIISRDWESNTRFLPKSIMPKADMLKNRGMT